MYALSSFDYNYQGLYCALKQHFVKSTFMKTFHY